MIEYVKKYKTQYYKYFDHILAKLKKGSWLFIRYLLIIGISFVIVYPLIVKVTVSLMTEKDLMDLTVKWIPKTFTLENYKSAFAALRIESSLLNSLFYSVGITAIQLFTCTLAAYGFARYKYPGSKILLGILIFTLVVPPSTYISSLYIQFRFFDPFGLITMLTGKEGLVNTMWPFIIRAVFCQGIRNGLYIYLMVQYFRNLPTELEEAANVDGAGYLRLFFKIILPNSTPALVTVGVLSVVWQWNDNLFTSMLATKVDFIATNVADVVNLMRIENEVTDYLQQDTAKISAVRNAAAMIMSVPIILFFGFIQKYFSENLSRTGIVG